MTIVGCSSDSSSSNNPSGSSDNTPPSVSSVTPTEFSTNVSTNSTIYITFSEDIDPSTVNSSSVTVNGVSGTVSVNSNTIAFVPNSSLSSGTEYTVTVSSSVSDMAGNSLGSAYTFSFTTAVVPVAVAGNDQEVSFGDNVMLDGTQSSDAGGATLTYTWTQSAGPSVGTLSGASPQFSAPDFVGSLVFELVVSNGSESSDPDQVIVNVLEDAQYAYYVSPTGDDGNTGSKNSPFATVQAAIDYSSTEGMGGDIYVAAGTYNESISLRTNVSIYGGFEGTTWERDIAIYQSKIMGGNYAVVGNSSNLLTIDGLYIEAAAGTTVGASSVGISLTASQGITITNNNIKANNGYQGYTGSSGSRPSKASNGSGGTDAYFALTCDGRGGGSGGSSSIGRYGGKGGRSGGAGGGANGSAGTGGDGISGGGGGPKGSFAGNGTGGGPGGNGSEGANGAGGIEFGSVSNGYYYASNGKSGVRGKHGGGGGGGGGGGAGVACCASGGGGGAGGVGGPSGTGGGGGGASIGIILDNGVFANIENNIITTSDGGNGSTGGNGAQGGTGGTGASGGDGNANGGAGGRGGNGGSGGWGGHGGGGGGGPTIGIVEYNSTSVRSNNNYILGTPGSGGSGGQGGTRNDPNGKAGLDGDRAEFKKITI